MTHDHHDDPLDDDEHAHETRPPGRNSSPSATGCATPSPASTGPAATSATACPTPTTKPCTCMLHTLALPLDRLEPFLDACIPGDEREAIFEVIEKRAVDQLPAAYITGEAWLGDFRFEVDPRVIVPRSYFAELLEDGFAPWVQNPEEVTAAMDMCTGSGCLAILMAHAFPNAHITAVDISQDALDVAAANIAAYGLEDRIALVKSDGFAAVPEQRFDFILSNPPYVTRASMESLPAEYLHEPGIALGSGEDGLDLVRKLLADAPRFLTPEGLLADRGGP